MGKKENKDLFENIENSEPEVETRQEEQIDTVPELISVPEFLPDPINEVIQEPIKKVEHIVILPIPPLPIPVITPKKNPDKLRKIKNNPKKYY